MNFCIKKMSVVKKGINKIVVKIVMKKATFRLEA